MVTLLNGNEENIKQKKKKKQNKPTGYHQPKETRGDFPGTTMHAGPTVGDEQTRKSTVEEGKRTAVGEHPYQKTIAKTFDSLREGSSDKMQSSSLCEAEEIFDSTFGDHDNGTKVAPHGANKINKNKSRSSNNKKNKQDKSTGYKHPKEIGAALPGTEINSTLGGHSKGTLVAPHNTKKKSKSKKHSTNKETKQNKPTKSRQPEETGGDSTPGMMMACKTMIARQTVREGHASRSSAAKEGTCIAIGERSYHKTVDKACSSPRQGSSDTERSSASVPLHCNSDSDASCQQHQQRRWTTTDFIFDSVPSLQTLAILAFSTLARVCVLFVPFWKVIDTSFLFREKDDPSMFDEVTDFFSYDSGWPLANLVDNGKDTYRIYFFILPFFLGFVFLAIEGLLTSKFQVTTVKPKLHRWLRYHAFYGYSTLDILFMICTLVYSAILLWARTKRCLVRGPRKLTFLYEDSKEKIDPVSWQAVEVMALSLGVLTITLLGWFVLMPIGRHSVLLQVLGVSWEAAVKYHRWLGWYTLVALLAHTFTYIAVWVHASGHEIHDPEEKLLHQMLVPGSCGNEACDSERSILHTRVMYGFAALLIMLVMSLCSIGYIRRHYFEVFFYVHQLFRLLIIFTCFHYKKSLLYLLPGIVILCIDKMIRFLSSLGAIEASGRCLTQDMFELVIAKDAGTCCEPGQYVFLKVPSVSVLEWHPITVTWTTPKQLALHIRTCGYGSWTQRVYEQIRSTQRDGCQDSDEYYASSRIHVKLDGFYGSNLIDLYRLRTRNAVLFVCGGCGLSFPFSIIHDLCTTSSHGKSRPSVAAPPVYLHWVTRTKEEYSAVQRLLVETSKQLDSVSISVWVTLHHDAAGRRGNNARNYYLAPASIPSIIPDRKTSGRKMETILFPLVWRPLPAWLWGVYSTHTAVVAASILLGTIGYALARNHEMNEYMEESRGMIFERLLELLAVVLNSAGLLGILLACRFFFHGWRENRKKRMALSPTPYSSNSSDIVAASTAASAVTRGDSAEASPTLLSDSMETVELGGGNRSKNSVFAVQFGSRPDMAAVFQYIARKHRSNVAVLACGPEGLVESVRSEYQEYIGDDWIMGDEEWLW